MKLFAVGLLAVVLAMLAAVAVLTSHGSVPKSGASVVQERAATGFSEIEISGLADVTLVQGDGEGVSLEGPSDAVAAVRTSTHGRVLTIQAARAQRWWHMFPSGRVSPTVHITVNIRKLERLEAAGVIKVAAASLRGDQLRLDLSGACELRLAGLALSQLSTDASGASKLELAGTVQRQLIDLSGAGSYQAGDLLSQTASIDVSGAGKALLNSSASLTVDISGAGTVEYLGDPTIEQSVSGVGKIRRAKAPVTAAS
jgi:hypothetical protein